MDTSKFKVVIVITVKNEAPYLLEWIAYHRAIGVDHFLIYNNDSTDTTPNILQSLEKAGIITYVEWPSQPNGNNQREAYRDACKRLDGQCEWVAFIDADEFIVLTQDEDLPSFLSKYEDVSGIAINWKLFGSSGHLNRTNNLVMERFTRCASSSFPIHRHFKTIAKLNLIQDVKTHRCDFAQNSIYCYPDRVLVSEESLGKGKNITHELIQINHYFTKSKIEWFEKRARGRATQASNSLTKIRSSKGFEKHDINDEEDLNILRFLEKTKQEIINLKSIVNINNMNINSMEERINILQRKSLIKYNKDSLVGGHLGSPKAQVEFTSNLVKIAGWVLGKDSQVLTVQIICNGQIIGETSVQNARPDVAKVYPDLSDAENCGFSTFISLMEMPTQAEILVQAILEDKTCIPLHLIQYCTIDNVTAKQKQRIEQETEVQKYNLSKPPLLAPKASQFLEEILSERIDTRVLEFGSGTSTVWLSKRTHNLVSIEHNRDWYDNVKNFLEKDESCHSVDLKLLPTPYHSVCDEFPDEHFDVIIVDGRDRIKCLESSIRILKKGGFLILDDAQRERYETASWLLQDWEFTRAISPARQTHWWQKPLTFEDRTSDWNRVLEQNSIRLYAGDLTGRARKDGWIGVSQKKLDEHHLKHDLTKPLPIPDGAIDAFQSEDVFEHIHPSKLLAVTFPEMYRVLKPGGFIRISLPDYRCDILLERAWKDESGKPYYDPGPGSSGKSGPIDWSVAHRGHVWFPTYETLQALIELSPLRYCKVDWLHYYDTNGEPVMNEIDYSKGFVKRTPDHDRRVQNPRRPMSIVVDLYKV